MIANLIHPAIAGGIGVATLGVYSLRYFLNANATEADGYRISLLGGSVLVLLLQQAGVV